MLAQDLEQQSRSAQQLSSQVTFLSKTILFPEITVVSSHARVHEIRRQTKVNPLPTFPGFFLFVPFLVCIFCLKMTLLLSQDNYQNHKIIMDLVPLFNLQTYLHFAYCPINVLYGKKTCLNLIQDPIHRWHPFFFF